MSAVAKGNEESLPYTVPSEYICAEIGRFMRLPVPPSALVIKGGANRPIWFASMDFNLTGDSLPDVNPAELYQAFPRECAGVLLFDLLVANGDRHAGNMAADYSTKPPRLSVFDHSHALFGWTAGAGGDRLAELRDRLGMSKGEVTQGNRHCLLDTIADDRDFPGWLDLIDSIPDFYIDAVCADVADCGVAPAEVAAVREFLKHRRNTIRDILFKFRSEFTAIKQWSLFS